MVDLALTSVPAWAVAPLVQEIDPAAREIVIYAIGTGDPVGSAVGVWCAAATSGECGIPTLVSTFQDVHAAVAAVSSTTASARIGARLMVAGPASDCAAVRAAALQQGWTDEEIGVGSTCVQDRRVTCSHCGTVTTTAAGIENVFACHGCARDLVVYYHFSRRTGTYLGFMVNAEDALAVAALGALA